MFVTLRGQKVDKCTCASFFWKQSSRKALAPYSSLQGGKDRRAQVNHMEAY